MDEDSNRPTEEMSHFIENISSADFLCSVDTGSISTAILPC